MGMAHNYQYDSSGRPIEPEKLSWREFWADADASERFAMFFAVSALPAIGLFMWAIW